MFNFGGADANGQANFVPFATILPYLHGRNGLIIAAANIVGNIGLLVPVGLLLPPVNRNITLIKVFAIAAVSCLCIETAQVVLNTGIFDIDDVILNALGVVLGYWLYKRIGTLLNNY